MTIDAARDRIAREADARVRLRSRRMRYQEQDSGQTLGEGLQEYYDALRTGPPAQEIIRLHDICHVVFGAGITHCDETVVDWRTTFSSDLGVRYVPLMFGDPSITAIVAQSKAELGLLGMVRTAVEVTPRVARSIFESWRTRRRWPWRTPDSFLDRPLAELRREYAIRVF
jgi:hypothetical protein